jgi:hypothetical protein
VKAQVILAEDGTQAASPDTKTLVIKYTASAPNATANTFAQGERLTSNNGFSATIINDANAIGPASYMKIDSGVFFAKGFPVRTDATKIILDKNSATPTCRIGFVVAENIISYLDDPTLVSNAAGFPNFAAPGADRLQLLASFQRFNFNDTLPDGYVELVVVLDGVIQSQVSRTQYDDLADELARRTYEQSGDFIVNGMTVNVKEHLDNGLNNGFLTANNGGNSQLLAIGVNTGEAYVKGYDVQYLVTKYTPIDKAIDFKNVDNISIQAAYGNFANVTQFAGGFDILNDSRVNLYDSVQNAIARNAYVGGGANGSIIGTARVRDFILASGSYGDSGATYDVFSTTCGCLRATLGP